jgi:hypothetical protein
VGYVIDGESELLEVQKGVRQVLHERNVQYATGACLQERYVRQAVAHNKRVIAAWEGDRENAQLGQQLLTLHPAQAVAAQSQLTAGGFCESEDWVGGGI